jgi:hypothetical protein
VFTGVFFFEIIAFLSLFFDVIHAITIVLKNKLASLYEKRILYKIFFAKNIDFLHFIK